MSAATLIFYCNTQRSPNISGQGDSEGSKESGKKPMPRIITRVSASVVLLGFP